MGLYLFLRPSKATVAGRRLPLAQGLGVVSVARRFLKLVVAGLASLVSLREVSFLVGNSKFEAPPIFVRHISPQRGFRFEPCDASLTMHPLFQVSRDLAAQAWSQAPEKERREYEEHAANLRGVALANRIEAKRARMAQSIEDDMSIAPAAFNVGRGDDHRDDEQQAIVVHAPQRSESVVDLIQNAAAAMSEPYPLSAESLLMRRKGRSISSLCQDFKSKTCSFARPPRLQDKFPDKVAYPRCCGPLCLARTPVPTLFG